MDLAMWTGKFYTITQFYTIIGKKKTRPRKNILFIILYTRNTDEKE